MATARGAKPDRLIIAVSGFFLRFLPSVALLLRLRENLAQIDILGSNAFAQRAEDGDVVGEPARDGFAVGQADVAIHFGAAGGEARHVAETTASQYRGVVPGRA